MIDSTPINIFNNPAVIEGGIGGIIALVLILVMWRMLTRIDDSIHEFNKGQLQAAEIVSKTISEVLSTLHDDKVMLIRAMDQLSAKLDVLMERTAHTWEQVAIHRGVSEPPLTGSSPAVITPMRRHPDVESEIRG